MRKGKSYDEIASMMPEEMINDFILIGRDLNSKRQKFLFRHISSDAIFSVYYSNLINKNNPNIVSCLDKSLYYSYLLKKVNSNFKLCSDYIDDYNDIFVRDKNGFIFKSRPSNLLRGYSPTYKSYIDGGTELFKYNANVIHKFKYDYSKSEYTKQSEFIDILCKKHGLFSQVAQSHLFGNGCPQCAKEINASGFSKTDWINKARLSKNFKSFKVYVIKCWDDNESFVKIGRTYNDIYSRFKNGLNKNMPYSYEVIDTISNSGEYIYDLENYLHCNLYKYKYSPIKSFNGETECFNIDILNKYKETLSNFNYGKEN